MDSSEGKEKEVHFIEEQNDEFGKDHKISVIVSDGIAVHLGFLQYMHRYKAQFCVPHFEFQDGVSQCVPNVNARFLGLERKGDDTEMVIELLAHKEKLWREKVYLKDSQNQEICLELNARVLGKTHGTPLLRTGVHLVGNETEDDSEQSDWQGFS